MDRGHHGPSIPYKRVAALMLSWKDASNNYDREEFRTQLNSLSEEFKNYRFEVKHYGIESEKSHQKLSRQLSELLDNDSQETLLIVYYGGHGLNNRDSNCIWLRYDVVFLSLPVNYAKL